MGASVVATVCTGLLDNGFDEVVIEVVVAVLVSACFVGRPGDVHARRQAWCARVTHHCSPRDKRSIAAREHVLVDLKGRGTDLEGAAARMGLYRKQGGVAIEGNFIDQTLLHTGVLQRTRFPIGCEPISSVPFAGLMPSRAAGLRSACMVGRADKTKPSTRDGGNEF